MAAIGTAAGYELTGWIYPSHSLRCLAREASVLIGGFVADLPRAVHFVAETPCFDVVRFLGAV